MKWPRGYRQLLGSNLSRAARQPAGEKRPLLMAGYWRRVPNFNLITAELAGGVPLLRLAFVALLILALIAEALLVPSLYQERSTLASAMEATQAKLVQIQNELETAATKQGEAQQLQAAIQALEERSRALEASQWQLKMLSDGITGILGSTAEGIKLSAVTWQKEELRLTVTGEASDYHALFEYRSQIQASPAIAEIPSFTLQWKEASVSFSLVVGLRDEEK